MLDTRIENRHFRMSVLIIACFFALSNAASAQNRVDLDDLNIKGELLNDNRLRLSARDQHKISDRVTYRTNFRKEISEGLEVPWPDQERGPASLRKPANGGSQ